MTRNNNHINPMANPIAIEAKRTQIFTYRTENATPERQQRGGVCFTRFRPFTFTFWRFLQAQFPAEQTEQTQYYYHGVNN
jgi:hypothetical protein